MRLGKTAIVALASALWLAAGVSQAKLTALEAERLGKDLTPQGAEKAGNKDGTIPEWTGGLAKPPAGFDPKAGYSDPFASDKPLFTITAENLDKYKDKLTPGQLAMFKKHPQTWKMHVYPTRRTAAYPQRVYDAVKKEATQIELGSDGNAVLNRKDSTTPFPIPKTGQEAMWNHVMRYRSGGWERTFVWFNVRPSGDNYKVGFHDKAVFNQNMDQPKPNRLFNAFALYTAPATLEGTVYLVWDPIDQVAETRSAWIYNAGQRRVRRAPELAYDNIIDGTEGYRVMDQYDGFNGALDRYDWKLLGKKEIYIAYNAYKLSDKKLKYKDIIMKGHINQDLSRYELHRVWVVEANLKQGQRHVYSKRTFYIDEDSWNVTLEEDYDARGQLWRLSDHHLMQFYDAPLMWYQVNNWYDLISGAYLTHGLNNEEKEPWKWDVKGSVSEFSPDNLRRVGTK